MTPISLYRLNRIKLYVFLGALLSIMLLLVLVETVFVSFILAIALSYALSPAVNYLEREGMSRPKGTALIFAMVSMLLFTFGWLSFPFLTQQIELLPAKLNQSTMVMEGFISRIQTKWLQELSIKLIHEGHLHLQTYWVSIPAVVQNMITVFVLTPFMAYFLVQDGRKVLHSLLSLVPNSLFEVTLKLHHQINHQIGDFVRARLLESFFVSFLVGLGLTLLDVPFAVALAVFAGITNLIPYVGPLIGVIPALVVGFGAENPQTTVLAILSVYGVAQLLDILFIIPLVVAKIVDLHPVSVLIAIIVGAQFFGVLGMLVAIPVASAIKVTTVTVYRHVTEIGAEG